MVVMNRLRYESSPYLLQHQSNPVDWYPWGEEALKKAKQEDKPILLSIGYSSCHWCHVMERESFTDPEVAGFMNNHFINIKLDREERPDLDKIYMDAVVAISGAGGWPLNCFLTPDLMPFYGGTYFPPQPAHQRPSWSQVLNHIHKIYTTQKDQVLEQAFRLGQYLQSSGQTLYQIKPEPGNENLSAIELGRRMALKFRSRFDTEWGGFGGAPKFPATMGIQFLFDFYFFSGDPVYLEHAFFSLDLMAYGGMYDQIGGGFARYATDREWNIPHFEKMLYDNAQLLKLYSTAYKIRPNEIYAQIVEETTRWLMHEMKDPDGGYYSAIDADSEHQEGKFYIWGYEELRSLLTPGEWVVMLSVYDIRPDGNWRDPFHEQAGPVNILWVKKEARGNSLLYSEELKLIKEKLLAHRSLRIRPLTDTKQLIGWNALLCLGYLEAYSAFQKNIFLEEAQGILGFMNTYGIDDNHQYRHQKNSPIPAMLDDLAYHLSALIQSYSSTGNSEELVMAKLLMKEVMESYYDHEQRSFKYSISASDLIAPANDLYDSTMPSAVGMMAFNLVRMGRLTRLEDYEQLGNELIQKLKPSILRYPESLSFWAGMLVNQSQGWLEVKLGTGYKSLLPELLKMFLPMAIICPDNPEETGISFCHSFSCEMPVESIQEFRLLLNKYYHPDENK